MNKFKVKNRQKRRYIRRKPLKMKVKPTTVSHASSRTITTGMLPILLAAMFFAFIIVAINPLYRTIDFSINVTMPTIPAITVPHFWEFQLPTVQLPKFTFSLKPIEIPVPHIDLSPAVHMVLQIGTLRKYLSETIISFCFETTKQIFLFDKFLIVNFYQMLYHTMQVTWNVLLFISKESIVVGIFLQQIGSFIAQKISFAINTLIALIEKPFIILGGYFEKCKPYLAILNSHMQQSLHEMSGGVDSINSVTSDFLGHSK